MKKERAAGRGKKYHPLLDNPSPKECGNVFSN
jgi:hypothetical protein